VLKKRKESRTFHLPFKTINNLSRKEMKEKNEQIEKAELWKGRKKK